MSSIISSIIAAATLVSNLTPQAQNGNTTLGTLQNKALPSFQNSTASAYNVTRYGVPWGSATATNVNPYLNPPNTGHTVYYDFIVKRGNIAPDGVNRSVLLVNDAYPGPTIEANWGDTISVTVTNEIEGPQEGTSIHWHGFLQKGTGYFDGTPGVHQCPIVPGNSFTYTFKADLFGTSWYHSHYSSQYSGGAEGAIVIYGPKTQLYDIDLGPVLISDWYHEDYFTIVEEVLAAVPKGVPAPIPRSANNLINGKMDVVCQSVVVNNTNGNTCTPDAGLSKFMFQSGKTHRLRLINAGTEALQRFFIDGHTLTVIANDFVPVQPYQTDVVTLGVGQRTDVLVTATGSPTDAVWMRANISTPCSANDGNPYALAAIFYEKADTALTPKSKAWPYVDSASNCHNDPLSETKPLLTWKPPSTPATVNTVSITNVQNASGTYLWEMNGSSFKSDYNEAILLLANENKVNPPLPEWNLYNSGTNTSIRIILYNHIANSHPMHLHGHNVWILAEGLGTWDGTTITNPSNPQRRDTQLLQPASAFGQPGYVVLEFVTDNPGVWPLHCHIAWHLSAGMGIMVLERPDLIPGIKIPASVGLTCTDWNQYTKTHVPDEIDSGI